MSYATTDSVIEENVAFFAAMRGEELPCMSGCDACHGEGSYRDDCLECGGESQIEKPCPSCGERKGIDCSTCGNHGILIEECGCCDDNGQVLEVCWKCDGSGGYKGPARLHPADAYALETRGHVGP